MNRRGTLLGLVVVVGVIALLVLLLATGGSPSGGDETGDVQVGAGPHAPRDVGIADIEGTSTRRDGDDLTFSATANHTVPHQISNGSLEYRWEIQENGTVTWILSVGINVDANVSLLATQQDYSSTSIDDSFPGKLTIKGVRVVVVLDASKLKNWPDEFEFDLQTTLDANRADTNSGLARDRAPDDGTIKGG